MLSKVLVFCALFVAAQANYGISGYGARIGGYAAHMKPRARLNILPGYGVHGYGGHGYGGHGYGGHGYGGLGYGGHGQILSAPVIGAAHAQPSAGRLAGLGLSLPSAGLPNADYINVPQHAITTYTAPAAVLHSGYGGHYSSSNAAIAGSLIKSAGSGYGPAQARGLGGLGGLSAY